MNPYVPEFIGGGIGSVARPGIGTLMNRFIQSIFHSALYAFIYLHHLFLECSLQLCYLSFMLQSEQQRLLIGVGFCGNLVRSQHSH